MEIHSMVRLERERERFLQAFVERDRDVVAPEALLAQQRRSLLLHISALKIAPVGGTPN